MKILQLISLKQYILLVFHADGYYRFSWIDPYGCVYSPQETFSSSQSAEQEGRLAIQFASR